MKTSSLFSALLACVLLATQTFAATEAAADWFAELDTLQQASHQDAGGRARAGTILRAVFSAARDGLAASKQSGRAAEPSPADANLDAAAAQAAYSALTVLYPQSRPALDDRLAQSLAKLDADVSAMAAGRHWGEHIAQVILADQGDAVFLNASSFAGKAQVPVSPTPVPVAHLEQSTAIGPGRYLISTLAGGGYLNNGPYRDGAGDAAVFWTPIDLAADATGNLYLSEYDYSTIRKITPAGNVTTIAGAPFVRGSHDGSGAAARFNGPQGLAVDGTGNVYVADYLNHTLRKISPSGEVTTIAGVAGSPGRTDGTRGTARLKSPQSVAVDGEGNVFFVENYPYGLAAGATAETTLIRKVAPNGTVSSATVTIEPNDSSDYRFARPDKLRIDPAGNLYAIYRNRDIGSAYSDVIKLTPAGPGKYAGTAILPNPALVTQSDRYKYGVASGIGFDEAGNLLISYGQAFVTCFPDGSLHYRYQGELGSTAVWPGLWGGIWATSGKGELYSMVNNDELGPAISLNVAKFDAAATGPVILRHPAHKSAFVGDTVQFTVNALGTPAPSYQWYFKSTPISGATQPSLDLPAIQRSDAGYYHVVVADSGGSVDSYSANLSVSEQPPPTTSTAVPVSLANTGGSTTTSGSGSLAPGMSLAVLLLLAAAARRSTP